MAERDGDAILALGLMSGNSMDGADAAMIRGDGSMAEPVGGGAAIAYSPADRAVLKEAAAEAARAGHHARAEDFATAARLVAERAAEAAEAAIAAAGGARPALVGFHGQTLFHAPAHRYTLQIGDAAWLTRALGAPVIHDFRSADVAAGGQGAPLAPFYHFAIARRAAAEGLVAFLNLGGVGNVTLVDAAQPEPDAPGALSAFDTGPANALLDDWVSARTGARYDSEGALALAGAADASRVARWIAETPFFAERPPKSIDRDLFSARLEEMSGVSTEDGAATLAAFTIETVALAESLLPNPPGRWLVTGGGRHNPAIMQGLAARLSGSVEPAEAVGVDGDLLEAQAFAHLAIRSARGLSLSAPGTTGAPAPMTGGRRVEAG